MNNLENNFTVKFDNSESAKYNYDRFMSTGRFDCNVIYEYDDYEGYDVYTLEIYPKYEIRGDFDEITGSQTKDMLYNLILDVQKKHNKQTDVKIELSLILLSYPNEIQRVLRYVGLTVPPYYKSLGAWKESGYWPGSSVSLIGENGEVPEDSYLAKDGFVHLRDLYVAFKELKYNINELKVWVLANYWWFDDKKALNLIRTFAKDMKNYNFDDYSGEYKPVIEEPKKKSVKDMTDIISEMKQYCKKYGSKKTEKYYANRLGMPAEDIRDMLIKYKIIKEEVEIKKKRITTASYPSVEEYLKWQAKGYSNSEIQKHYAKFLGISPRSVRDDMTKKGVTRNYKSKNRKESN